MALKDRKTFPHLFRVEAEIFHRWLQNHEELYDRFEFDLRVGDGAIEEAAATDAVSRGFKRLTQKRVDVVGFKGAQATIFEVRPDADQTALGNLLAYQFHFIRMFPSAPAPNLAVITDRIEKDDAAVFKSQDVEVYIS